MRGGGGVHDQLDKGGSGSCIPKTVEEWQGGKDGRAESRTKKLKLHDPVKAIQELNKMDGVYQEQNTVINNITMDKIENDAVEKPFREVIDG